MSALGFLADLGFLPTRERSPATGRGREGSCGHGVVKLVLVTVVHVIVQRKRRRGHGKVHGAGAVPSRSV